VKKWRESGVVHPAVPRILADMNFEEKQSLGRVLCKKRKEKNWTQEHLAGASGVPLRSIQRAEKGEGIGKENLSCLANVLGIDVQDLLREANAGKEIGPELRLSLRQITKPEDLIGFLGKKGNFHFGPSGEHSFNDHLGECLIELQSEISNSDPTPAIRQKLKKKAAYVIAHSKHLGFSVFAVHYREELHRRGKIVRKPTTIVIAAHEQDHRIKKTSKGLVLDYVMDSRRQMLGRLQQDTATPYDWMQHTLISKLDGEERAEGVLRKINDRILRET
jgi:transcriptional regulator with XRE-family HTH domain